MDGSRSIPLDALRGLGTLQGIEWWLFQRGEALQDARPDFGRAPHPCGMLTEAEAMRELDLLVSVDTCSAHLAGAAGVAVWMLLPFDADWRWMRERSDTPWYPRMRLFHQRRAGDWACVIEKVTNELKTLAGSGSTPIGAGNRCC